MNCAIGNILRRHAHEIRDQVENLFRISQKFDIFGIVRESNTWPMKLFFAHFQFKVTHYVPSTWLMMAKVVEVTGLQDGNLWQRATVGTEQGFATWIQVTGIFLLIFNVVLLLETKLVKMYIIYSFSTRSKILHISNKELQLFIIQAAPLLKYLSMTILEGCCQHVVFKSNIRKSNYRQVCLMTQTL